LVCRSVFAFHGHDAPFAATALQAFIGWNSSPLANTAQAIRASLFANATAALNVPSLSLKAIIQ
jgi:hypothetical protein